MVWYNRSHARPAQPIGLGLGGFLSTTASQKRNGTRKRSQSPLWLRMFVACFLVIFFISGIISGFLFYAAVREIVAQAEFPAMPAVRLPSIDISLAGVGEEEAAHLPQMPVMTAGAVTGGGQEVYVAPPPPVPDDRINILLLGIDRRGKRTGWGYLTDTIIIVTVDRDNNTAGMLSIPRDLQVPIPGSGEDRINTANVWGTNQKYPGGGTALLERTIEASFNIPIDYYIIIDFRGFEQIVDRLGGIEVNVPRELHDTKYPNPQPGDPHGYKTVHFDAGLQHLDGASALQYARSRMSTSDFERAKRQQQILIAIREKALGLNLIPKLPSLAAAGMDMVKTDMTLDEMVELAALAPQIDMANVKQVVIQKPMVYGYRREDGAAVQLPKWDLIDPVVADLFGAPVEVAAVPTPAPPTPTPTLAPADIEQLQDLARDGARIAVQNGTSQPNFAARVAALLMEQGYQVVEFGDADRLDYPKTVLVDYTGKTFTLDRLVDTFHVTPENVRYSPNLLSRVDIRLVVGQDSLQLVP